MSGLLDRNGEKLMATHFQGKPTATGRLVMEGTIRECYGRVTYSHKTHEKSADMLLRRLSRIKLWQIILASATTAGFFGTVFGVGSFSAVVGTIASTVLLALNLYTKDHDLGKLAQEHRQGAADLWLVREEYLALLTDLNIGNASFENITERRDSLLTKLHGIYSRAPSTNSQAYKKAQEALQLNEEMTFSDSEIDTMLPKELHRGASKRIGRK